jgi:hypothetical protein
MAARFAFLRLRMPLKERFRRFGWLALWLIARHSLHLWSTALVPPDAKH